MGKALEVGSAAVRAGASFRERSATRLGKGTLRGKGRRTMSEVFVEDMEAADRP